MKRILLLSSILMLSAVWAMAQYGSQPSTSGQATTDTTTQSSHSSTDAGSTTLQGCLGGSDGNYSLTDKTGTKYQLSGDTSKMTAHVGHTVQVMGTSGSGASSSTTSSQTGSMSGSADSGHTFNVTSFKHISGSCDSSH